MDNTEKVVLKSISASLKQSIVRTSATSSIDSMAKMKTTIENCVRLIDDLVQQPPEGNGIRLS